MAMYVVVVGFILISSDIAGLGVGGRLTTASLEYVHGIEVFGSKDDLVVKSQDKCKLRCQWRCISTYSTDTVDIIGPPGGLASWSLQTPNHLALLLDHRRFVNESRPRRSEPRPKTASCRSQPGLSDST